MAQKTLRIYKKKKDSLLPNVSVSLTDRKASYWWHMVVCWLDSCSCWTEPVCLIELLSAQEAQEGGQMFPRTNVKTVVKRLHMWPSGGSIQSRQECRVLHIKQNRAGIKFPCKTHFLYCNCLQGTKHQTVWASCYIVMWSHLLTSDLRKR